MLNTNSSFIGASLDLFGVQVSLNFIVFILATLAALYGVWREGRRDGFDEEHLFDNYIFALLISALFSRVFFAIEARFLFLPFIQHVGRFWTAGFNFEGFLLGFLAASLSLSFLNKWSTFRILDIFSLSLSIGGAIGLLGWFLLVGESRLLLGALGLFSFYILLSSIRLKYLISGVTFLIFVYFVLLLRGLTGIFGQGGLLFNSTLVTIGVLTLVFRIKKKMSTKRNLPTDIFTRLKATLQKKEASLADQKRLLEEEDPYMQEGRTEGNSDDIDEANLEDNRKNSIDAQKGLVERLSQGVRSALAKMSKGDYGTCEKCGSAIDPARLQAYPEAALCSDCARKEE